MACLLLLNQQAESKADCSGLTGSVELEKPVKAEDSTGPTLLRLELQRGWWWESLALRRQRSGIDLEIPGFLCPRLPELQNQAG